MATAAIGPEPRVRAAGIRARCEASVDLAVPPKCRAEVVLP
jgi:hypothetical protein